MVAGLGLQSGDLARVLAGRLVMVGGQFRASNDWVESPVQGEAPGVHYHAMALDNLVEDGANYRRNGNMMFDSDLLKSMLIAALAFFGIMGVMARNSLLDHAIATRMEPRLRAMIYGPLYLVIFGASIAVVAAAFPSRAFRSSSRPTPRFRPSSWIPAKSPGRSRTAKPPTPFATTPP